MGMSASKRLQNTLFDLKMSANQLKRSSVKVCHSRLLVFFSTTGVYFQSAAAVCMSPFLPGFPIQQCTKNEKKAKSQLKKVSALYDLDRCAARHCFPSFSLHGGARFAFKIRAMPFSFLSVCVF